MKVSADAKPMLTDILPSIYPHLTLWWQIQSHQVPQLSGPSMLLWTSLFNMLSLSLLPVENVKPTEINILIDRHIARKRQELTNWLRSIIRRPFHGATIYMQYRVPIQHIRHQNFSQRQFITQELFLFFMYSLSDISISAFMLKMNFKILKTGKFSSGQDLSI